ncbi:ELMO domain-containing protein 2 [Lycorma delicatula]|uniref:ELMO domain-containing protein 2 n=1 Tax=Lycorma delicatula TaxID=130591 RepID=UPI003F5133E7
MFSFLWLSLYNYLRPFIKWILRKTTKLCELQRICYGEPVGYLRSYSVEQSLYLSKSREIKEMLASLNKLSEDRKLHGRCLKSALEYAVNTVVGVKDINPYYHKQFIPSFVRCSEHIWGYRQLLHEVESLRTTPYDPTNSEHEKKLLRLWSLLMPNVELEGRVTKQWQDIGFQGDDPKTDFRGMGILGLDNLVFFAEEFSGPATHVLSHSLHPQYGYAFAIVGINLTSMAYHLLKDGAVKTHIYNSSKSMPSIRLFHQLYCYLFYEFDRFWLQSKPKNIMDFTSVRDKFENNIRTSLSNPYTVFRINILTVDTI